MQVKVVDVHFDQSSSAFNCAPAGSADMDSCPSVARAPFSFGAHWKACSACVSLSEGSCDRVLARKIINFILWPLRVVIFVLTLFVAMPLHYLKPHEETNEGLSAVAAPQSAAIRVRIAVDVKPVGEANDSDRLAAFLGGVGDIAPGSDGRRYTVTDILALPHDKLESYDRFIQWIFPTTSQDGNPDAATVSNELIEKLAADSELVAPLIRAWDIMAPLWGFKREDQDDGSCKFVCQGLEKEKFLNNIKTSDHNMSRITRAMQSSLLLSSGCEQSDALARLYSRAKAFARALEECCKSDNRARESATYLSHWCPLFERFKDAEGPTTPRESATDLEAQKGLPDDLAEDQRSIDLYSRLMNSWELELERGMPAAKTRRVTLSGLIWCCITRADSVAYRLANFEPKPALQKQIEDLLDLGDQLLNKLEAAEAAEEERRPDSPGEVGPGNAVV